MLQCSICRAFPDCAQTAAESVRQRESWSQTRGAQHRACPQAAPHKTSTDRDPAAEGFQIHKQPPLWWVSRETHAAVRTCG